MKSLSFEIDSNQDLWDLVDKSYNHVLIQGFMPFERIEWWKTELKMPNGEVYDNMIVRNMNFDIKTDLNGLKRILDLKTDQFSIYQFDRDVSDTLIIESLPQEQAENILYKNGLKHTYLCDFEVLTISTFDDLFIMSITERENIKSKIDNWNRKFINKH